MDRLESENVKEISWTERKTQLDVAAEKENPKKHKGLAGGSYRCESSILSARPSNCNPQSSSFALPLVPIPKVEEWCSNTNIVLTGTACSGRIGPPVGVVDIGVSKSAYYFCISLPGVKRDPGEFCCNIQRDGKVCIRGVTSTGAKTVTKYSRVFKMKLQQQCPSGPFTLFFSLPGPVDPRLFSPCFRSDGIFEAVVAKDE